MALLEGARWSSIWLIFPASALVIARVIGSVYYTVRLPICSHRRGDLASAVFSLGSRDRGGLPKPNATVKQGPMQGLSNLTLHQSQYRASHLSKSKFVCSFTRRLETERRVETNPIQKSDSYTKWICSGWHLHVNARRPIRI